MKYRLDKNKIIKKREKEIEKLKDINLSGKELNSVIIDIETYDLILNELFNQSSNKIQISKDEFIEQACDISENLLTHIQRLIYKSLFPFLNNLNELNHYNCDLPKNILTINDQKELILNNFIIPNKTKNEINKLFNYKYNKLHITHQRNRNCIYPLFNGECYLSCTNKNDIKGFISLCHEIGHYYEHYYTNNRINKLVFLQDENIYNYKEVTSIFFELISIKILIDNNLINANQVINTLKEIKDDYFSNPTIWLLFDEIKKTKKLSNKDFNKLKNDYGELYDATIYSYSYIIAVNLFEQYLINEKEGFEHLNYIINNILETNEEYILENCNITYKDTNLFERHIKRMEK